MATVRVCHGVGHRDHVVQEGDALLGGLARDDQVAQRSARDQLHRVERRPVGPAPGLVHRHDARVLEARGDQRLAQEADLVDVAARDQLLDRDVAPEVAVVRAEHPAQAAAAVLAEDHVALGVAVLGQPEALDVDPGLGAGAVGEGLASLRILGGRP